jgi:Transposase DNA-binding
MPLQYHEEPRVWAEAHFIGAEMSDVRRIHRVVTIAEAMAARPGCNIPQMFAHAYDIKAAYNLFHHPESTPDHLQADHQDMVLEQMHRPPVRVQHQRVAVRGPHRLYPLCGLCPARTRWRFHGGGQDPGPPGLWRAPAGASSATAGPLAWAAGAAPWHSPCCTASRLGSVTTSLIKPSRHMTSVMDAIALPSPMAHNWRSYARSGTRSDACGPRPWPSGEMIAC